jgi:hypothetical protein
LDFEALELSGIENKAMSLVEIDWKMKINVSHFATISRETVELVISTSKSN